MDRHAMRQCIEDAYAARVRGDVDGVMRAFTPDARFRLNVMPSQPQMTTLTEGAGALRQLLAGLMDCYRFSDLQILDCLVDGSKAAVRLRFAVECVGTGQRATTESVDIITFRDGRISDMTQFFDTALAAQLVAPVAKAS